MKSLYVCLPFAHLRLALLLAAPLCLPAQSPKDLSVRGQVEEMSFPNGYEVVTEPSATAVVVKRMPAGTANVAAHLDVAGRRYYMTDWSYSQFTQGKTAYWIRLEGAAKSASGLVVLPQKEERSFPGGYEVVSDASAGATLVKSLPESRSATVAAYQDVDGVRYYMTDWSYDRHVNQGIKPNWIRGFGAGAAPAGASAMTSVAPSRTPASQLEPWQAPADEEAAMRRIEALYEQGQEKAGANAALEYYQRTQSRLGSLPLWLALWMSDAGVVLEQAGLTQQALTTYGELATRFVAESDDENQAAALGGVARCQARLGEAPAALRTLEKALALDIRWSHTAKGVRYSLSQHYLELCAAQAQWQRVDAFVKQFEVKADDEEGEFELHELVTGLLEDTGLLSHAMRMHMDRVRIQPDYKYMAVPEIVSLYRMMGDDDRAEQWQKQYAGRSAAKVNEENEIRRQFGFPAAEAGPQTGAEVRWEDEAAYLEKVGAWHEDIEATPHWPTLTAGVGDYDDSFGNWVNGLVIKGQRAGDEGRLTSTRLWLGEMEVLFGKSGGATVVARRNLYRAAVLMKQSSLAAGLAREELANKMSKIELSGSVFDTAQVLRLAPQLNLFDEAANSGDAEAVATAVLNGKGLLTEAVVRSLQRTTTGSAGVDKTVLNAFYQLMQGASGDELAEMLKAGGQPVQVSNTGSGGAGARAAMVSPGQVASRLRSREALVEYAVWRRMPSAGSKAKSWWSAPRYLAVVIRKDAAPAMVDLGPVEVVDKMVKMYGDAGAALAAISEAAFIKNLQELHQTLLRPLEPYLAGTDSLVISPDASLHFLNFTTLMDERQQFAGKRWACTLTSSGRHLLDRDEPVPPRGAGSVALVMGDPAFSAAPSAAAAPIAGRGSKALAGLMPMLKGDAGLRKAAQRSISLAPLPGSDKEALSLADQLKDSGYAVELARNTTASEPWLYSRASSARIIHFATHGLLLEDGDVSSSKLRFHDPMLRSCLALAGASHTFAAWAQGTLPVPDKDGVLLAGEIAALDLSKADLVVLSACSTAAGQARSGEGVFGLRRGLQLAGARSVMLTLWPIADAETVALMGSFYARYLKDVAAPAALQAVQMEELEKLRTKSGVLQAVRLAGPFVLSER